MKAPPFFCRLFDVREGSGRKLGSVLAALGALHCGRTPSVEPVVAEEAATHATTSASAPPARSDAARLDASRIEAEQRKCRQRIDATLLASALPGVPAFQERREALLGRAKAHPSVFVREPEVGTLSKPALALRQRLAASPHPSLELFSLYRTLRHNPIWAREVLLTEGYLYSSHPALAYAMTTVVRLGDLFDAPELFIQRGDQVLHARRRKQDGEYQYFYANGPEAGGVARVWLLDRVAVQANELEAPLHLSFDAVHARLGFDSLELRRLTADGIVADARYGADSVATLFRARGAGVELDCELVPSEVADGVLAYRDLAREKNAYVAALRSVIDTQIDERLPFDEPRTEVGQEDGKLRQEWKIAYRFGHSRFEYNEDVYRVFDHQGRPRVPQVCIDFVVDTFERASGSWYQPRGEERLRRAGRLSFDAYNMENKRSVENFVAMTESRSESFQVWQLPREEQIPFAQREKFFDYVAQHRTDFVPGDVVVILGKRSDDREHYHSFFVIEADPISGMPTLLASNAGTPRVRTWEDELQNAPKRSIRTRIRPRIEWLRGVIPLPSGIAFGTSSPNPPPI